MGKYLMSYNNFFDNQKKPSRGMHINDLKREYEKIVGDDDQARLSTPVKDLELESLVNEYRMWESKYNELK